MFDLIHFFNKHLKDSHTSVRCRCLSLIGHLTQEQEHPPSWAGPGSKGEVQDLLASFSEDSDPRVRTSALQALVSEGRIVKCEDFAIQRVLLRQKTILYTSVAFQNKQ